ncbi:hypothetical protein KL905_002984 [Ogataea polymorpha]|nr:hypothetical protein KL936_003350 [Ogataea polymorpha]KAG7904843.1 hypothetical protein KL907_003059 [Ogataea polymorpha]KAG7908036.1 hypothetical protein KL906_003453 [Ogataea polymorpha]KAG7916619.1 hypothetical protein KL927_003258 [Ogataea polymorpha]KAG7921526.1 hypothetical protein KL905_002984 [Ogataea polymorpha]
MLIYNTRVASYGPGFTSRLTVSARLGRRCFSNDSYTFRNFQNGHTIAKHFETAGHGYLMSLAFEPKDRLKDVNRPDDGLISKYRKKVQTNTVYDSPTGEDNYVMAYNDSKVLAGVLDGVGGWSEQGFDSSAISRELSTHVTMEFLHEDHLTPLEILDKAYTKMKQDGSVEVGSTTICFGVIDAMTNKLHAVNLGDSWFGVFRKQNSRFKCVFESKEQTYSFNAPYQLSVIPQEFLDIAKKKGSKYLMNLPKDADEYEFQLESGDVIMFTTDGLIDNVVINDVALYLDDCFAADQIGEMNMNLVRNVKELSLNSNFKSVFSQRLSDLTGQDYIGGKPDDITSVVVYVQ